MLIGLFSLMNISSLNQPRFLILALGYSDNCYSADFAVNHNFWVTACDLTSFRLILVQSDSTFNE